MSGQSTGNLSCGHRGRMVQFEAQEPKLSQVACDVVLFVSYVVSVLFIFILYYLYVILCYLVGFLLIICMLSRNTSAWKLSNLIAIKVHFKDERRSQEHIEKRSEELSRTVKNCHSVTGKSLCCCKEFISALQWCLCRSLSCCKLLQVSGSE
jgi:hypothetical protein